MNTRVANVIAIELGILIAILAWLAISRVPSVQLLPIAQERVRTGDSFATVTPVLKPRSRNFYATSDVADHEGSAQVAEELTQTAPEYVQEIATEPNTNSDYAEDLVAETLPYSAAVEQAPLISSPDCYVAPVEQVLEFVQPSQIIVFSITRLIGRSNRSPACFGGGRTMMGRQCPGGGKVVTRSGGLPPRQNASAPPARRKPGNVGSMGSPGDNRTPSHAGNGRASGGPISALQ
jgi:hypothetical protein